MPLIYTPLPNSQNALQTDVPRTVAAPLRNPAPGYGKATIGQPGMLAVNADPLGLEALDGFDGQSRRSWCGVRRQSSRDI